MYIWFSHICMDFFLTWFSDHCCYQSLQIFPQNSGFLCREFWSRLPRKGKQVYCPRVLKATEDEASLLNENARWDKDRVTTHTDEFWGPPNGGEFSKGNGTPYRLFQGNLGWWKDYSIWPEAWRKHSHGIFLPIQLPSCSRLLEREDRYCMSLEALKAFSPQVFGGSFTPILTRFYACLENVWCIYGRGSLVCPRSVEFLEGWTSS